MIFFHLIIYLYIVEVVFLANNQKSVWLNPQSIITDIKLFANNFFYS